MDKKLKKLATEEDFQNLKDWQQKAFVLLYKQKTNGLSQEEIAEKVGVTPAWLSKFKHSDIYQKLALRRVDNNYLALGALAIKTIEDILKNGRSEIAKAKLAQDIIEKISQLKEMYQTPEESKNKGNGINIFIGERSGNISLSEIRGMKENVIKEIEGEIIEKEE